MNALVVSDPRVAAGEVRGISPLALADYFATDVIHGPDAFTVIANGYPDFADAMRRKLIRELSPLGLSFDAPAPLDFLRIADHRQIARRQLD